MHDYKKSYSCQTKKKNDAHRATSHNLSHIRGPLHKSYDQTQVLNNQTQLGFQPIRIEHLGLAFDL